MRFAVVFMLRINLAKNELIPFWASNVEELVLVLDSDAGVLPTTYWGLSLGASFKSTLLWDVVEYRLKKNLRGGKDNIFLKEEDWPWLKALCQACQISLSFLEKLVHGLRDSKRLLVGWIIRSQATSC